VSNGDVLRRAREFLLVHGRLIERRAYECLFEGGSTDGVGDAVRAYRNGDGGIGHALEPDLRCAASQPIHLEFALDTLIECGVDDPALVRAAADWLETVSTAEGSVSPALPGAADSPCADHWKLDWAVTPAVNPTAGLAARLHILGVEHPWRERATSWSLEQIETGTFPSAHTLREALLLLDHIPDRKRAEASLERVAPQIEVAEGFQISTPVTNCTQTPLQFEHPPDRKRAEALLERVVPQIEVAEWFQMSTPVTSYTQTPLHFAPTPDAPLRRLFTDAVIEAHLDDLIANQRRDGGWPVYWTPPGPVAEFEWRGRWTLDALKALRAYGRI
jgi:hypothetical protein